MFRVLIIGTGKRKNIDLIYQIVAKLIDFTFVFVGEFDNYLGLNNLKIYSNVNEENLVKIYKNSDLLLFPSLSEGFGIPIIEAQFFGIPVVTSNKEPMKSVAGESGAVLVNPLLEKEIIDAIYLVRDNQNIREQLIQSGKQNVLKYDIQNIILNYKSLYKKIESDSRC